MIIPLTNTIKALGHCFEKAEKETVDQIKEIGTCIEIEVTLLFRFNLTRQLRMAGEKEELSKALVKDLKAKIPVLKTNKTWRKISKEAEGLVAGVSWHPMQTEGKITGADFALLVKQPKVDYKDKCKMKSVKISSKETQFGLLAQAKLKRYDKEWGQIKPTQKKLLTGKERYLTLLLYEYDDKENTCLRNFRWNICKGKSIDVVAGWLKEGKFPKSTCVSNVLKKLAEGKIGTKDKKIIKDIIIPNSSQVITVWIDWPDDSPNPSVLVETIKSLILKGRQNDIDGIRIKVRI